MYINLSGLNILVTGATGGIGRAVISRLCESGAVVGVHHHKKEREAENLVSTLEGGAYAFPANFEDLRSVSKLFVTAWETLGSVEVLINTVGVLERVDMSKDDNEWVKSWNRVLLVNLTAMALLCKKAIQHWLERDMPGRIINVASGGALMGFSADCASYAASKSGVISFTRSIAKTYAKNKIVAYSILPGEINSLVGRAMLASSPRAQTQETASTARGTEPRDIAPMIACLCSGLMDYASGATIDVSTGQFFN